jgi:hypothetical protein
MGKQQFIVQFRTDGDSGIHDFDSLIRIEDILIQAFSQNRAAVVDGHDAGGGKVNIFVVPRGPVGHVLEIIMAHLKRHGLLHGAVIAKQLKSERLVVVWPTEHSGDFTY